MSKPNLVLSNTTTFFSGSMERVFKKAKKHGFKYLEIVPYRWSKPEQILALEKKYQIEVVGIHMPEWWSKSFWQAFWSQPGIPEKAFTLLWAVYIGSADSSPGWKIAKLLQEQGRDPYVLLHSDVIIDMGNEIRNKTNFHIVVENIPYRTSSDPELLWNPIRIEQNIKDLTGQNRLVFDPGHFNQSIRLLSGLDLIEIYKKIQPEVIHISYNRPPAFHVLPNKGEQAELIEMLKISAPKHIVVETNPLVSVAKAKRLMEQVIKQALSN